MNRVLVAALLLLPALFVPVSLTKIDFVWASDARMLSLATYAVIYAIVAYGLAMLMRFAGLPSVVHGALWGIGAYTAAILAESYGWSFWAILPTAALLPAVVAILVGLPSLRTHGLTFMIVTLALCDFLVLVGTNWDTLTKGPLGIMVFKTPEPFGPLSFTTPVSRYYLALAFLYATLLLVWLIARSAFGRRLASIRDNEILARSLGLNSFLYKLAIFTVTAMVVGIAGVLYVYHQQAIQPSLFGAIPFIDVLLMVVMGGMHVLAGPAVGAWLVQFLPEWLHVFGLKDPNIHRLIYGALLVAFITLAPQGIAGTVKSAFRRLVKKPASSLVAAVSAPPPETAAPREIGEVLLEARDVSKHFGALRALDKVSFSVRRGEVLGVIGPNGSGKTTLFNCISGVFRSDGGSVRLLREEILHRPMDEIARRGLVRTFQHPMVFATQTVRESVQLALDIVTSWGRRNTAPLALPRDADGLLVFCGLADVAQEPVHALSYGHTRLLGVALALASSPHVLMLDEPAAGLNHVESARLAELLLRARRAGATFVVVDHDMAFLLPLCDRILVLDAGARIAEGTPQEVRDNPDVVEVYLGRVSGAAKEVSQKASPAGSETGQSNATLQIRDLVVTYGPIEAVHGIALEVAAGEAVALLGANGAGKTTALRALSGLLRPRRGQILWDGADLVGHSPADILKRGIAHVPEGRMVFARQTVEENLLLGQLVRHDRDRARRDMEHLLDIFPALKPKLRQPAGDLSGGQQQMLAIARSLMSNPRLLLLDEPSLGLSPLLVEEVALLIARLRAERSMSLLLVEQNPLMAARLTERVYVLQNGRIRSQLPSQDILGNVELLDAYLGKLPGAA